MTIPAEVETVIDRAVRMFRDAQDRILDEQATILSLPPSEQARLSRRSARLSNMLASVEAVLDDLRVEMGGWLQLELPLAYQTGAQTSLPQFAWTQIHVEAVNVIANDMWNDVLATTEFVDRDTRRWIREVSLGAVEETLIEGRTFAQARRDIVAHGARRQLAGDPMPITSVRYANGALHSLDTYSEMLIRTKTVIAHNQGTVTAAEEVGTTLFEVFDQGCGWSFHDDPRRAHGLIVTAAEIRAQPTSHPNCRRSVGPRPDLSADDAGTVQTSTTEEQQAAQAAADQARLATQATRNRTRRAQRAQRATRVNT